MVENVICTDEDKELAYFEHCPCFVRLCQFSRPSSWFGMFYLYSCSDPDISVSVIAYLLRAGPALLMRFCLFVAVFARRSMEHRVRSPDGWRITWVQVILNTIPVLSVSASLVVPAFGLGF